MAARALTAALLAELTAKALRPVFFFEGEFTSGTVRLWSGAGDLAWNAQTWTGAGQALEISPIEESNTGRVNGLAFKLNGVPAAMIAIALAECRMGKPGTIWFGALDAAGTVVADPHLCFRGRLDVSTIEEDADKAIVTVTYESRLIDHQRARERRYTHEDQQIDYPGDRGFEYVASLQDKPFVWGRF